MALTEEQKRKLQEKAAVEIAAIRQKQEENEYYDRLLAEQGIVKTVHTQRDQKKRTDNIRFEDCHNSVCCYNRH